jgi:hypothetical protein
MPLPAVFVAPLTLRLLQLGAAVAVGAILAARRGPERVDMATEDALDRLPEGGDLRLDPANGRADADARLRRTVRLGRAGVEIEAAGLARLRVRRTR